jgi:hypothetical protein
VRLAETTLAVPDFAAPQTQIAAHRAVFQLFLQAGLNELVLFSSAHAIHPQFNFLIMSTEISRQNYNIIAARLTPSPTGRGLGRGGKIG